jgi:hypothetical protein
VPIKRVATSSLNLRSEPLAKPSTLIVSLPFGHKVEVVGNATRMGWVNVRTSYNGKSLSGVTDGILRESLSAKKEDLLASAAIEWDRFKRGSGKEDTSPYYRYVGEMWRRRGQNLDGKNTSQPWSAACISFIIENAGYKRFKFAIAHSVYIHEAITARLASNDKKDFWGYRLSEHKPQVGDLVCRKRSSAAIDFDYAAKHDAYKSHTDIVVAIGSNYVDAIGGNVSNSVSITRYSLTPQGRLDPDGGRVFALLRNNN